VAAAAAGVLLMLRPVPPLAEALRVKGADTFALFVREGADAAPLGAICSPGDMLRARYGSDLPYLLVVGVDGAGAAQVLFPQGGQRSAPIDATPRFTPGSWVLDAPPGVERFVALFSPTPLAAADVLAALRAGRSPPGDGVRMQEARCHKATQ
jgi:hypothetical protein